MLALAAKRCEGHANVNFHEGGVTALPVADADFDRALSVQVLEYVADIPAALGELRRVLRPGGRVLIWDVDWATVSWHSRDPDRMQRFLHAWDEHLTDPRCRARSQPGCAPPASRTWRWRATPSPPTTSPRRPTPERWCR